MEHDLKESTAITFFQETSFDRISIGRLDRPSPGNIAALKTYPEAKKIPLPRSSWKLTEARIQPLLQHRRSTRKYGFQSVTLADLAFILWASQGVTAKTGKRLFRTSPSAGALYPIETYISIHKMDELDAGLYHFDVEQFQLELIQEGSMSSRISRACLDQNFMGDASFCLVWTAVTRRCMSKYGDRGARYILLDAAHICQNALLAAEATGSGGCPVAAFYDEELCSLLDIDGIEELPVYAAAVGKKR